MRLLRFFSFAIVLIGVVAVHAPKMKREYSEKNTHKNSFKIYKHGRETCEVSYVNNVPISVRINGTLYKIEERK